jgi:plastocyanin
MRPIRIFALLVLALSACDDDDDTTEEPQVPEPDAGVEVADVTARDDVFDPEDLTVPLGTTVRWTNAGMELHSVTSGESPESGTAGELFDMDIEPGETFSFTFDTPGLYRRHGPHARSARRASSIGDLDASSPPSSGARRGRGVRQ